MMRMLVACVAVAVMVSAAAAVDLKNEDSTTYQLKIHDGPAVTDSSIEGGTTKASICSDCTIEVVGVGEIQASGDQVVIIRDGQLVAE